MGGVGRVGRVGRVCVWERVGRGWERLREGGRGWKTEPTPFPVPSLIPNPIPRTHIAWLERPAGYSGTVAS